jgi:antagonist of KipI
VTLSALRIIRGGLLSTVQDLGRWGSQASGVPVAGPMDVYSHRLANRLAGNDDSAAALEVTLVGPEMEAQGRLVCAVAGAEFDLRVDGRPVHTGRAFEVQTGGRITFGQRLAGARATLAIRGGIEVPEVSGSRATSLSSRMGPFGGRPLTAGDLLPIGRHAVAGPPSAGPPLSLPQGGARLRAIPGPHEGMFTADAVDRFHDARFTVSTRSNRMGYRLAGPVLAPVGPSDILSTAVPVGAIQIPRSGEPILLMADRQTTGGYPIIATVISADLPLAGQLAPGDWIRFSPCTRADAVEALQRLERRLTGRAR